MAFQRASELSQRRQQIAREVASLRQDGVEKRGRVPFAQYETIALRPLWVFGVITQHAAEVESGGDLHAGERAGRMARARGGGAGDDLFADRLCPCLQI